MAKRKIKKRLTKKSVKKTTKKKVVSKKAVVVNAKVGVGVGTTINIGNYESVKLHVYVELPSEVDSIEQTFVTVKEQAEKLLAPEIKKVRESIGEDKDEVTKELRFVED